MTPEMVLEISHYTLLTAAKLAAPFLISSVVIGVLMNVFQTVTQLKDQSLTFIPKVVGVTIVGLLAFPWEVGVVLGFFNYIVDLFGTV
jgi:flagellar biosynthetic protein FliQ